ncbi:filamin-A-interacting protein 1-like isoform X2 [Thalassophryne amazonica]|uniref:filamin-A-interacting protein 1-like isoform X2 n=1 Tax=Thalassophryne amazonica TaxID=390379 RepID=UPI001471AA76|nr:filamin-A-interacting protein 1-like isoform X2 [Thalassophryne amazonica]
MRSRSCTMDGPDDGQIQPTKGFIKQDEDNTPELTKRKTKVQREEKDGRKEVCGTKKRPVETSSQNLSKEDLLRLLGIMEGEVQAREDIINLLRLDRTGPEILEAHYGSAIPTNPLQALQRDGLLSPSSNCIDDVYETPMIELDRLENKQRETYRRMLEQLLLAEKCHRRTINELDNEKRKHADFINKSDDFTNLLEQERERLKKLLEQEKAYQARKDKDQSKRLEKVRAELVKLKSFALMLVDERQLHIEQIDQQSQKVQDLTQKLQEKEQRLAAVTDTAKEDSQKVLKLEAELEHRAAKFAQDHEELTNKLANQETQSRQLRLKLASINHKVEQLEESNKLLQKSEEDLQELKEKISKGECGSSTLIAEVENLRKKVQEMEGKDEEITKTETQCKELKNRLQDEQNHSKELRLEVDKMQKRMVELEKLEGAFTRSKTECSQLHINLEKEKRVVKDLASELDTVKSRVKELESSESRFDKVEMLLKDDLMKLKSFTVILVDERKNMAERLKLEEQKSDDLSKMLKVEQSKVMEVTEKLFEESKKLLKLKSEMEDKVTTLTEEKDKLKTKLASEEGKCRELSTKITGMKVKMDRLEDSEREMLRRQMEKNKNPEEDNKIKELTLEIERLKSRLKQLEVVEGDLMKTEDQYDLLEKKFRTEQDKANSLSKLLEEMKSQIARNKAVEKGEAVSPEAELRLRWKMEETRTRELQLDVQALKEKIHELMNKEDQLSQLQVDYSLLQQRLTEEGQKKKSMMQEVVNLTKELEATKCYSRALRPSMNGRRMVDVPVTSTAVQTDIVEPEAAEDETAAGFIRKSVLEEHHLMSNLRQQGLKKPTVLERYPPASLELAGRRSWIPWMKKKEAITFSPTQPHKMIPKPLHIRVTSDHENSTATLEITSPRAEDFFSSTTIIPTLGHQKPRITIVPKPTTVTSRTESCSRTKSPVTITTISRAKSPEKTNSCSSDGLQSPVSIITVSTTPVAEACASPEPQPAATGRTVFRVTPEKQSGFRKFNSNIITTEDNKIHIHLGSQFRRPPEACRSPLLTLRPGGSQDRDLQAGTVLCSPRPLSEGKTAPSKMTSSITITPVTSPASKPTPFAVGSDIQAARTTATRIPLSKGPLVAGSWTASSRR